MEYRVDRRLNLVTEPEYKSLYPWAIKEVDEDGNGIGNDQVPWVWTLYFTASSYTIKDSVIISDRSLLDDEKLAKPEIIEKKHIIITLKSAELDSLREFEKVNYAMLGTSRSIEEFQLVLHRLDDDSKDEVCTTSGSISYIFENDFRRHVEKDYLCFDLQLKPLTFDRYISLLSQDHITSAIFSVGYVSGFYSDWSPSISTRNVKILADTSDQGLIIPAGFPHQVRSLREVGKASLVLHTTTDLDGKEELDIDIKEEIEISEAPPQPAIYNYLTNTNQDVLVVLNTIKNLILILIAIAVIILVILW